MIWSKYLRSRVCIRYLWWTIQPSSQYVSLTSAVPRKRFAASQPLLTNFLLRSVSLSGSRLINYPYIKMVQYLNSIFCAWILHCCCFCVYSSRYLTPSLFFDPSVFVAFAFGMPQTRKASDGFIQSLEVCYAVEFEVSPGWGWAPAFTLAYGWPKFNGSLWHCRSDRNKSYPKRHAGLPGGSLFTT